MPDKPPFELPWQGRTPEAEEFRKRMIAVLQAIEDRYRSGIELTSDEYQRWCEEAAQSVIRSSVRRRWRRPDGGYPTREDWRQPDGGDPIRWRCHDCGTLLNRMELRQDWSRNGYIVCPPHNEAHKLKEPPAFAKYVPGSVKPESPATKRRIKE